MLLMLLQDLSAAERGQFTGWQVIGQIDGPTQAIAVQGDPSTSLGQVYAYAEVGLRLVDLDVTNPFTLF